MSLSPTIRIAAIVAVTIVAAVGLGGLYLLSEARGNETAKIERSVEQAWTMGRLGTGGTALEQIVAVGRRLVEKTEVAGGTVRDVNEEEVARFGEVPPPAGEPTLRERLFGRPVHQMTFHDSAHDVTLYIDAEERVATLRRAAGSVFGLTLLVASLLACVSALLGERWVSRPLRLVAERLADPTPEGAEELAAKATSSSSLGVLTEAAGELIGRFCALEAPKLRRAHALFDNYPHPIMIFTLDSDLVEANRAALRFFAAGDIDDLTRLGPIARLTLHDGTRLKEALAGEPRVDLGKVRGPGGDVPCHLAFDCLQGTEGDEDRLVVTFIELSAVALEGTESSDVRVGRMTAMLESCMFLLQDLQRQDGEDEEEIPVDLDAIVRTWGNKSVTRGLIGELAATGLPPVAGHFTVLERILATALHLVQARSQATRPDLVVQGEIKNDGVAITIVEAKGGKVAKGADVAIPSAALMKLLAREGATLVSSAEADEPNRLSLHLASTPMPRESLISYAA